MLLHPLRESPKTCHISYAFKRGWPFLPVFQESVYRFNEAGLLMKWYEQTQQSIIQEQRIARRNYAETLRVLALSDVQTAFYMLGIGQLCCVLCFVGEIVHARRAQTRATKKQKS